MKVRLDDPVQVQYVLVKACVGLLFFKNPLKASDEVFEADRHHGLEMHLELRHIYEIIGVKAETGHICPYAVFKVYLHGLGVVEIKGLHPIPAGEPVNHQPRKDIYAFPVKPAARALSYGDVVITAVLEKLDCPCQYP